MQVRLENTESPEIANNRDLIRSYNRSKRIAESEPLNLYVEDEHGEDHGWLSSRDFRELVRN